MGLYGRYVQQCLIFLKLNHFSLKGRVAFVPFHMILSDLKRWIMLVISIHFSLENSKVTSRHSDCVTDLTVIKCGSACACAVMSYVIYSASWTCKHGITSIPKQQNMLSYLHPFTFKRTNCFMSDSAVFSLCSH